MSTRGLATLATLLLAGAVAACGGGGGDDGKNGQASSVPAPGMVAYTAGRDLILRADGEARVLQDAAESESFLSPAFSPDGTQIAYVRFQEIGSDEATFGSDLHITDLAGNDRAALKHQEESEFFWTPIWAPDGESLIYAHQLNEPDDEGRSFLVNTRRLYLATGETELLQPHARDAVFSPNGRLLAFVGEPETSPLLQVKDLESGKVTTLADSTSSGLIFFRLPKFSPDGEWIAFAATGDGPQVSAAPARSVAPGRALPRTAANGVQDLWLVRPDGTNLIRLTNVQEDNPDFAWANDGESILMRGLFGVYMVDVDTRAVTTLGPGELHGGLDWRGNASGSGEE